MLRGDRVCPGATDSLPLQCSGRPRLCWALLCLLLRATGSAPVVRWTFCRTFACALPLLLRVTGSAPVARWICRASPHTRLASLATASLAVHRRTLASPRLPSRACASPSRSLPSPLASPRLHHGLQRAPLCLSLPFVRRPWGSSASDHTEGLGGRGSWHSPAGCCLTQTPRVSMSLCAGFLSFGL